MVSASPNPLHSNCVFMFTLFPDPEDKHGKGQEMPCQILHVGKNPRLQDRKKRILLLTSLIGAENQP